MCRIKLLGAFNSRISFTVSRMAAKEFHISKIPLVVASKGLGRCQDARSGKWGRNGGMSFVPRTDLDCSTF